MQQECPGTQRRWYVVDTTDGSKTEIFSAENVTAEEKRVMRYRQQFRRVVGIVGALMALTGCAYTAAVQQLPPEERTAFRAYNKIMTSGQTRTYLAQGTPAARAAYLEQIGIAQRFQALDPVDRTSVLDGYIRKGMSADALRFLWGHPYYTRGHTGHYEYWQYLGSAFNLADRGNSYTEGTVVIVYLVDDKVDWWLETTPTGIDKGGSEDRQRR
jgi:hypothetical protein